MSGGHVQTPKVRALPLILLLALAVTLLATGPGHSDEPAFRIDPSVLDDLGARFDHKGLRSVSAVLAAPDHPHHDWVRHVRERLATLGQGSGVVLHRARSGAALLVTAAHVLPYETLGSAHGEEPRLRVLFAPPITRQEHERQVPRDKDFAVVLLDDVRPADSGNDRGLNEIHLPGVSNLQPGQEVLLMGAPAVGNLALMYSLGRVLSKPEALRRDPTYNEDRQFILQGSAAGRMSGGGVFARDGSYLGVITTGFFAGHSKALVSDYVGGVRATWIEKSFLAYLAGLTDVKRKALTELIR